MDARPSFAAARLSRKEVVSYGLGEFASVIVFNFMGSYLLYFFTDVAGIGMAAAGMILSTARLLDAAVNPFVGILSDRTSTRWGKLRPYLLFPAFPLALSVIAIFLVTKVAPAWQSGYAFVTYTLFCLLYTLCNVPYSALMPNMTEDDEERNRLNRSRFLCFSIASLISTGLAMPLVSLLGKDSEENGYIRMGLLFACVVLVFFFVCFANTRERVRTKPAAFNLKTLLQTARKSKPWLLCCCAQLFFFLGSVVRSSSAVYYAKYYLDRESIVSILLAMGAVTTFLTSFLIPVLSSKMKKKAIVLCGYGIFAGGCLFTFAAGQNLIAVLIGSAVTSFGASLSSGVMTLILGETIDHSEYATGTRQQGLLTSVSMFMTKMGIVLSSVLSPWILERGGYAADQAQSASAVLAIRTNFVFIPLAAALICMGIFLFYHLDEEYPAINQALRERHRAE